VRWLDRLLACWSSPERLPIAALERTGQLVEVEGRIEALRLLEDPVQGASAVLIHYRARIPGLGQRYFGVLETRQVADLVVVVDFVLRDETGAARIVVEGKGPDLVELHVRLLDQFGVALMPEVDLMVSGEWIRVRGRVRSLGESGSPHRRDPDGVVVVAEAFERV
jgi:hypothetical protein